METAFLVTSNRKSVSWKPNQKKTSKGHNIIFILNFKNKLTTVTSSLFQINSLFSSFVL